MSGWWQILRIYILKPHLRSKICAFEWHYIFGPDTYCNMALIEAEYNKQRGQKTAVPMLYVNDVYKSFDYNTNRTRKNTTSLQSIHEVLNGLELKINEGQFVT